MAGTYAPVNLNWVEGKDSSASFTSPEIPLDSPVQAIQLQLKWEAAVLGSFKFQATIYDDLWEDIPECTVKVFTSGTEAGHKLVFIPSVWLKAAKIRYLWEPSGEGSSGVIGTALRIAST